MKNLILIILVLILSLSPVLSVADITYRAATDKVELYWGMSMEEVKAELGPRYAEANSMVAAEYEAIAYPNIELSKFSDFTLVLYFAEGILIGRDYIALNDSSTSRYDYLKNALTNKYGNSIKINDILRKYKKIQGQPIQNDSLISELIALGCLFSGWITEDDTLILLYAIPGNKYSIGVVYLAPDALIPETQYNYNGL